MLPGYKRSTTTPEGWEIPEEYILHMGMDRETLNAGVRSKRKTRTGYNHVHMHSKQFEVIPTLVDQLEEKVTEYLTTNRGVPLEELNFFHLKNPTITSSP